MSHETWKFFIYTAEGLYKNYEVDSLKNKALKD